MNKEIMKKICELNYEAYKEGCISLGGHDKCIHLTTELFKRIFKEWSVKSQGEYDRWYVIENGFEFFCLVEF